MAPPPSRMKRRAPGERFCADYLLRPHPPVVSSFLTGPLECGALGLGAAQALFWSSTPQDLPKVDLRRIPNNVLDTDLLPCGNFHT